MFEGKQSSIIKCLNCENVSSIVLIFQQDYTKI